MNATEQRDRQAMATTLEALEAVHEANDTSALLRAPGASALDLAIGVWLDAKAKRSGSAKTSRAYRETLASFRAACQSVALDLDAQSARDLALVAQGWAGRMRSRDGKPVTPATFNQRLAILSSFYMYARKQLLLVLENPIALVERRPVQSYARAVPMPAGDVAKRLAAIDRSTAAGLRDYALLVVALQTGRRVSELAGLRWGDVERSGANGRIMVTWQRCKGGKTLRDELPVAVGQALLAWLTVAYGGGLEKLSPDAPIWRSLARDHSHGLALGVRSMANIYKKRLGTSKVHVSRHTFAHSIEALGVKMSEIQAKLGHASLQTTGRYLQALASAENTYGDALAALYGVIPVSPAPVQQTPSASQGTAT
jgi:integrase